MTSPPSQASFIRDAIFSGKESIGQRDTQEDFSLFRTLSGGSQVLAVMADGMGGHASGEVASKKAVEAFSETFANYPNHQVAPKLAASLQQANSRIAQAISELPALDGMGCTLIGAHVGSEGLQWISVGDSVLYLFRSGKLKRLNADHSMMALINDSVKSGKMSESEAKNYPFKNALRSAITGGDIALIDGPAKPMPLYQGDIVMLATDGILSLSESEITHIIKEHGGRNAQTLAISLIKAVDLKKRPKQDNTSIQVIVVPDAVAKRKSLLLAGLMAAVAAIICASIAGYYLYSNGTVDVTSSVERALGLGDTHQPRPTAVPVDSRNESSNDSKTSNKSESLIAKPAESESSKASAKKGGANSKKQADSSPIKPKTITHQDGDQKTPVDTKTQEQIPITAGTGDDK